MKRILALMLLCPPTLVSAGESFQDTEVTVRALAHDAKLIPGVEIVIADADSDEVLARGMTEGDTGDTGKIVKEPIARGAPVYDTEGAAGFNATLGLREPRRVRITAVQPETGAASSRTMWLSPGHDVTGNGVLLRMQGLKIGLREPTGGGIEAGATFPVTAEVRMLCGCPVEPGGLWNADGFTVTASLLRDGKVIASGSLDYAGSTSMFSGELAVPDPGEYTLRVTAVQPAQGNTGVESTKLTVSE